MKRSQFLHAFAMQWNAYTKFLSRCNAWWFISGCLYSTDVEWNQQPKDCYDARVIALNCSCWAVQQTFVLRLTFAGECISLLFRFDSVQSKKNSGQERAHRKGTALKRKRNIFYVVYRWSCDYIHFSSVWSPFTSEDISLLHYVRMLSYKKA